MSFPPCAFVQLICLNNPCKIED